MDVVRREAAAPAPIPFPWKRALPGLVVAGFTLIAAGVVFVAEIRQASGEGANLRWSDVWMSTMAPFMSAGAASAAAWTLLALAVSLVSVMFSLRFASGRD
jgi:hypothetical protein